MSDQHLRNLFLVEQNVWNMVIKNDLDEIRERLAPDLRQRLARFEKHFWTAVVERAEEISRLVERNLARTKSSFAEDVARYHPAGPALYAVFKSADSSIVGAAAALIRQLRRRTSTVQQIRYVLGDPTLAWASSDD